MVEIINNFFGCDAAYFDVNPFDLATHLLNNGVDILLDGIDQYMLQEQAPESMDGYWQVPRTVE